MSKSAADISKALSARFKNDEISFAPKETMNNGKAKIYPHVKAEPIINRLNSVMGVEGWKWSSTYVNGSCIGTLSLKFGDEWVSRSGTGAPMRIGVPRDQVVLSADIIGKLISKGREARQEFNRTLAFICTDANEAKSAETDAFKRAARMFGIAMDMWTDYAPIIAKWDAQNRVPIGDIDKLLEMSRAKAASHPGDHDVEDDDDDEDGVAGFDDDDEEEEEKPARRSRNSSRSTSSSTTRKRSKSEPEDDDDDDEEEEEEKPARRTRNRATAKKEAPQKSTKSTKKDDEDDEDGDIDDFLDDLEDEDE